MWLWFTVLVLALLLTVAVVVALALRGRAQARGERNERERGDEDTSSILPALVRELRPSFNDSLARLRKGVRGIDFRYGVPWYLLIGPADAGKTTLVAHAPKSALLEAESAGEGRAVSGIGWHYFDGGVVIDVSASLALPGTRDSSGWRALLHLLKRYRPRRPVEGIIVAVPASLLLDPSWKARTHDLGAAIRERLVLAQAELGFAVPVYVIVTQADRVAGFSAFIEALPDNLQQDMLGWSNPHTPDVMFQGEWIDEAFEELHRGIVHVQVELFAVSEHLDHVSDLFLFSGELQRLAVPLRELLEDGFRPSVYRSASLFRGFYLSGRGPDRDVSAVQEISGPPQPISFVGDLLDRKVFSERGLALPLPGAAVARNRVSAAAQIVAALLVIVLAAGTLWSNARLQRLQEAHEAFFQDVATAFDLRNRTRRNERSASAEERITQGYQLLQSLARLGIEDFHSIFLPSSIVRPIEPSVERILQATFGELILPDFRVGLEEKGRTVFGWNGEPVQDDEDDSGLAKPTLADSAHYRALERFVADYRLYVDNYFKYHTLSTHESGDINQLAELGNYVTGHTGLQRLNVPERPYGRALRDATARKVDCGPLAGLVDRRARETLSLFGSSWFGERNPVRASELRFVDQWTGLIENGGADLTDLIDEVETLSQAVSTWASIGARSGELRLPVLEQAPFKTIASGLCDELKPDLSEPIRQLAALRDGLTPTLLVAAAEPFGPLLDKGEKGLELGEGVRLLKDALDKLETLDFRTALPTTEGDMALPIRATWRPEAIDHAVALYESFDRYRSGAFPQFAPTYRRPLVSALEEDVAAALAARLAFDATEGDPLPSDPAALSAAVGRLGTLLTKVSRIIPFLETGDEPFARELERRLDAEAADALQRLDREAAARHPSVFSRQHDALFAAWAEAQSGAAAPADVQKRWAGFIDEQRESLRRFAVQADPLVRFLNLTRAASLVTRRWTGIVDDVSTFDQKMAGNGLGSLDTFLRDGLPAIVPDKDCGAGGGFAPARAAGSFLVGVRNELLEDVTKHCRDLARSGVQTRYAAIAQSFTNLLASRFPFTQALEGTRDASPADVTEFLRLYDRQDGRSLAAQLQTRACADEATRFLRRIDALYPLLAPARELPAGALALDVLPEFRVNRDREIGGAQIVQWSMDVGKQSFRDGEPAKPARWISGDPVQITLRFAKDSPERPLKLSAVWRHVADRTVRQEFHGTWALLSLLRAGHAAASDLVTSADAAPNTLRFEIPVEHDPERRAVVNASQPGAMFRVYIRVRVFQPGKQDPIAVDEFPAQAPATVVCPGT